MKILALGLALAITAGTAFAEDNPHTLPKPGDQPQKKALLAFIADTSAFQRINLSGKLRMLSQRIPSAACHLAEGSDPEGAKKLLTGATNEFAKIVNALEVGDTDLNINQAEEHRKVLETLAALKAKWAPMQAAADAMAAGDVSTDHLDVILNQNMVVLEAAKLLVSELSAIYSDPTAMVQADAIMIDISGRQRMLTQKMSKESCMLSAGLGGEKTADDLANTMKMFEVSLTALRFGMADAGINPPPTPGIAAGLEIVQNDWYAVKPYLVTLINGATLDPKAKTAKFQQLNVTMKDMNEVVGLYSTASLRN